MGVYIKGMEMPKTCDDCFLPLRYCPYAMKPNGECPLIPVPPHGRWNNIIQGIIPSGQCSNCGAWDKVTRFCPNCGSQMEGE